MMFRYVPDSLLHFADPTIPGLSGRDLIERRSFDDNRGLPEPVLTVRRPARTRPTLRGRVIHLASRRHPAA